MKKTLVLLLALILVGFAAYAQTAEAPAPTKLSAAGAAEVSITGSAKATFGYDLNDNSSGFTNVDGVVVDLTIIPNVSKTTSKTTKDADGNDVALPTPYGYLSVANVNLRIRDGVFTDNDTVGATTGTGSILGTVTAFLYFTPQVWLQIYGAPSANVNFYNTLQSGSEVYSVALAGFDAHAGTGTDGTILYGSTGGMKLGFDFTPIALTLSAVSVNSWDTAIKNTLNVYAFGATAVLTMSPITFSVSGSYGINGAIDQLLGIGEKVAVTLPIPFGSVSTTTKDAEGKDVVTTTPTKEGLVVYLASDQKMALKTTTTTLDVNGGVKFNISPDGASYVGAEVSYSKTDDLDMKLSFSEPIDAGLMKELYILTAVGLYNLTSTTMLWAFNTDLAYKIFLDEKKVSYVKPYVTFGIDNNIGGTSINSINLTAGLYIYRIFPQTDFTLQYTANDLSSGVTSLTNDKGIITFATTISL